LTQELTDLTKRVESGEYRGNPTFEDEGVARVVFNPYDFCPSVREIIETPGVSGFAKQLIGKSMRLDHTKLMCKPAKTGSVVHHHQDYYYWQDNNPNQVAMFIAIDPCTEENGCLRVFAGSQVDGLRIHTKKFHEVTGERHWACELEDKYLENEVVFVAEPGDVCFFSALTVHRSDPNTSEKGRRCLVAEFDELGNLSDKPGWGSPIPAKTWE
jgi:ectoine hydroxylase-related dioxygenase (phytanoyl-CoA dioxygenase family)